MENKELSQLIENQQTPLYVFDLGELKRRISFLRSHLPQNVQICYAMKANSFIVKDVSKQVDGLEICSPGEYRICKRLGLPVEQYVISGVYKEDALMEEMISAEEQPEHYTVESLTQFTLLRDTAKRIGKKIPVLLRLTSGNQFGMDQTDVEQLIRDYKKDDYIHICGIQFFSGTQKTSLKKM